MLKSIDVLIGVAVVMLVVSATVTALTQFILHIRQSKGKKLKEGIADLLQLIAPDFKRECAEGIAASVLTHPLVRRADGKLSDTVHREELVKILLELSTATTGYTLQPGDRDALKSALEVNGIKDPEAILANARSLLLQLEMSRPDLSNAVRTDMVLLQEASSDFLAKIHSWFDQTIDRTIDRFTVTARQVTFVCAAVVVVFLQLDTISLINQLSTDAQLRNTLVQQAMKVSAAPVPAAGERGTPGTTAGGATDTTKTAGATGPTAGGAPGATTAGVTGTTAGTANVAAAGGTTGPTASVATGPAAPGATTGAAQGAAGASSPDLPAAVQKLQDDLNANSDQIQNLASLGLFRVPNNFKEWAKGFASGNTIMKVLGLFISVVLLSLGAPFWYNALKTLIGLRSVVAGKDDEQRNQRQTQTTDTSAPATAAAAAAAGAAAALRGERGVLG